jgi:hypothetical protein
VPGLILAAAVTPDNTPGGYILTFAAPIGLFVVVAAILYLLLSRPHRRIPARRAWLPARTSVPEPGAARAASIAGGLPLAAGGGATETHLEAAGAIHAAETETGTGTGSGLASGPASGPADAEQPDGETPAAEGTEASQ